MAVDNKEDIKAEVRDGRRSEEVERKSSDHGRQESTSLKRNREGSLEPTAEALAAATTKKNRLGDTDSRPNSPLDEVPEDTEDKPAETNNVGEVRKKVEEMTWKDGKKPEGVDEWEEIDRAEASGTEEDHTPPEEGKDLKRKLLERSESSQVIDDHAKRQKDTPSPEEDAQPTQKPVEPKKTQPTFASFATSSPFKASTPAKPVSGGFGSFSATANPFSAKKPPAAPAEEPEAGPSKKTFGDILSSANNEDDGGEAKVQMTEQEGKRTVNQLMKVATGEEDERTVHSLRTKLYVMQADGGWKERGVGLLKLNVGKENRRARLVMRAEGVLRLILNVSLYVGMTCLEDGKHVRMTVFEDKERRLVTFRTGSNKVASELCEVIREHIPLESASASRSPDPEAARS